MGGFLLFLIVMVNWATKYKDFIISIYGETFVRKTPSGGFHIYYNSPRGLY